MKTNSTSRIILSFLFFALSFVRVGWGQSTANYAFTTNTTGSLALDMNGNAVDMSTGTTQLVAAASDQGVSSLTNIGFNFLFFGSPFTQFSASANGILQLGSTLVSSTTYVASGGTTTSPKFSPLSADAITASVADGGGVFSKVIGTSSNRCLVIQWVIYSYYTNTSLPATFQVRLYESSGIIEYVYGSMPVGSTAYSSNYSTGFSAGTTTNTFACITTSANTNSVSSFTTNAYTAGTNITNLHSTANGSRRVYRFTPPLVTASPTNLTFSSVSSTGMTLNWTAASPTTGILKYNIYNSIDGGTTYNYISSVNLGTNTYVATGLIPSTTYTWKVTSLSEGTESSGISGTQATAAAATYYYVGAATGSDFSTAASWNTNSDGSGTNRTVAATSDILIIDGIGTTNNAGGITIAMAAAQSLGALQITNNTAVNLQSSSTTTRTLTLTGSVGDELSIPSGSTLSLTNSTQAAAIVFATGTGMTGNISGTLNIGGSTSNALTTTGGTSTVVTVSSTGVVNNSTTAINLIGSASSLIFSNGSNCNISGTTTGAYPIPLATWGATSNLTLSGASTSTTTAANNVQSFGNFIVNLPSLTGTLSFWTTSTTAVIQGDLTISSTGTGIFRALTSGSLTINGNLNITGGKLQPTSSTGTFNVLGSTIIGASGTLDHSAGSNTSTYSQRGATFTNNGTILGSNGSSTGTPINFVSPTNAPMVFDGNGTISSVLTAIGVQTTGGLTINHSNQIPTLRVNLFNGVITNSNKITIGTGATLACVVQTGYTANTLTSGSFDQLPTFNLGTGTYSVIYSQESANRNTGFEIPSTRVLSNVTLSNTNGITISGGALSSAALTLSTGCGNITTSSSNVLTITGTATSAITRTSTTAFVNGPLELTLPASLVTGSTYLFPIGKTTIAPFELVNPTTNAGGTVVVRAEVFDGNCGGTAGNILASISNSRYWAASVTSGSTNLTNSNIRLTAASTTGFDAIGNSSTVSGAYGLVGGVSPTITGTTIASTTPLTAISGFYLMGTKAAAALSSLSITPSGNQCTHVSRAISVLVTPGGGAVTGVSLNYSINGVAQTAIAMSNSTNNGGLNADTWIGTIPTVTPVNASITWSITATDVNSLTQTISGTGYADAPNTGAIATATATQATVCEGNNTSLNLSVIKNGTGIIGSGSVSSSSSPTPFSGTYGGMKGQYIILASELISAGYTSGNITGLGINFASAVTATYTDLTIQIGNTLLSVFNSTLNLETGLTTVYGPTSLVNPIAGVNNFTLSTPFNWDGVSNIIISTSWSNNTTTSTAASIITTTTATNLAQVHKRDSYTPSSLLALTGAQSGGSSTVGTARPNFTIIGNKLQTASSYSWSNGTSNIGTTNPLIATVTSGTTFTGTATLNGCPMTASVTPTVNPLPTAPTGSNSTQCGNGIPTASVSDNNGYTTPTIKWYSASTGGTLLQTNTSTTYLVAINTTTTFYVAVVNPSTGCESVRTAVTVTVNQPDAISASASASTICLGQSVTLTAANTASTPTQNYTYSWVCATTGSGATSSITTNPTTITPTLAGTYVYTATGVDGACTVINTASVTVNPNPIISTAIASPTTVCSGSNISLTGTSVQVSSGVATLGNGLLFGTGTTGTFLRQGNTVGNQFKTQYLFLASELQAAGLQAGNITGLTFDVYAAGGGTVSNLTFKLGNSNLNNLTTTYVTGLSQVFSVATYPSSGTVQTGLQSITFNTPFNWDGISNIVLEACAQLATAGTDGTLRSTATSFTSTIANSPTTTACTSTTGGGTFNERPNFKFNGQIGTNQAAQYDWSWNSSPSLSTATGTTVETNTGASATSKAYTVTATNASTGCSSSTTTSSITINPATVAPTATNSSHCGSLTPTCSVSGTGTLGNTFAWYTVSTGGTAISGQTASTLSSYPISTTTTLYVSENNGTCQSARTPINITVATPPAVTITASVNPVCSSSATVLSALSSNSGYSYSWDNGLGTGSSVTASPTSNTTYTVSATDNSGGASNGCTTTATLPITVNPVPSAISLTPSSTQNLCTGNIQSVVASGGVGVSQGSVTLGSGTGVLSTAASYAAFNGYRSSSWIQTLYTASELTALGLSAGNITSIAYNINSQGSSTSNNITIKIGTTSSSSFANNTLLATTNFTTVYGPSSYSHSASGWQTIIFATPYNWDGVSNLIIDVWQDGPNSTADPGTYYSVTTNNQALYTYNVTPSASATTGTLTTSRFNIKFTGAITTNFPLTWTPTTDLFTNAGATTAYTGTPSTVYSKPTANRTYTATATTAAGCSTSASVTINVAAPTTQTVASTDYIWKGTTSTAWGTLSNWTQFDGTNYTTPSAAPTSSSVVVIPQNNACVQNQPAIGSSSISVQDFKIESGATTTLNSGAQLTISGTLTNNGTLTLESGATLVQGSSSTLAGTGAYNVKQTINGAGTTTPSGRYWYLGSPVSSASSSVYFASNAANVLKKRDEVNNAWTAITSGSPEALVVGQGYYTQAIPATSTINFTGGLLNNGSISVSGLTRTAGQGYEGFNLVSNPYPSYLNWDNVTRTNVDGTIWYRTHDGSAMVFDTYVAGSGGVGTNLNGTTVSNYIPPMQSFWVRVSSGSTTGGLAMDNTMRSHFTSVNGSVAGLKSTSNDKDLFLRMNLHNSNKKDQLIVYVNDQATNTFDQLDGEKMMQAGYPQFYTKAGDKKIVINGLNSAKKQQALPITMELVATGVHSFEIEDLEISNGLVWLEDKQEELIQALEPGTIYEFYSNAGIIADRFVLHFQLLDSPAPTNAHNEVGAYATFNGKGANVHAEAAGVVVIKMPAATEGATDIQIRDAAGKLVYSGSMNALETSVQLTEANGIYYVTLNSATGVEVKKVFLQQ